MLTLALSMNLGAVDVSPRILNPEEVRADLRRLRFKCSRRKRLRGFRTPALTLGERILATNVRALNP